MSAQVVDERPARGAIGARVVNHYEMLARDAAGVREDDSIQVDPSWRVFGYAAPTSEGER